MFSASLLSYFLPIQISIQLSSLMIVAICLSILFTGHFKSLDKLSKFIMISLTVSTIAALLFAIASSNTTAVADRFVSPSPWSLSALGFLVITMGWMPAPIEISSINSIWLKRQSEEKEITSKTALFDFNVGYVGTTILAVVFLSLGALILHGSGTELASPGIKFSHQLVSLYSSTIGDWSKYLVAGIAFLTIFGSTITIIDGYGRALSESQRLLSGKSESSRKRNDLWMLGISLAALAVIVFWAKALIPMLDFAMVMAFVTTPVFALLNYILITRTKLPNELKSSKKLKALSIAGLVYLYVFLGVFVWWKWIL
jgi:Mn2+/Fe2+ NRAMP family transporter